jgi:hypothetical protein
MLSLALVAIITVAYVSILHPAAERTHGDMSIPTTTIGAEVLGTTVTTAAEVLASTTLTAGPAQPASSCDMPAPEATDGTMAVRVAYPCPGAIRAGTHWVTRRVPQSRLVLTATVGAMLEGPTPAEEEAGFTSYWPHTDPAAHEVSMSSGVAYLDVAPMQASVPESPAEGVEWLAATASTVFQFDTVRAFELRIAGDCDAFWQSIGGTDCVTLRRGEWSRQLASWREASAGPPETRG